MTSHLQQSLLRRTAVAIAALAASLFTLPASALTMSLPGGGSCTSPQIATQPDGSLMLTCGSTQQQPPPVTSGPDTFTLTSSVSSAAVGTAFTATITRSGTPSTSNVGLNIAVYGACSSLQAPAPAGGTATFTPTTTAPLVLNITPSATGSCNILFNVGFGGATAVNTSMTIPVGTTVVPPPGGNPPPTGANGVPVVAGCPTPTNATMFTMPATAGAHTGNYGGSLVFTSGVIGSAPLPSVINGHSSAQLQITYSAFTTAGWQLTEIAISKCPGVIDVVANGQSLNSYQPPYCYYSSTNPADVSLPWTSKLSGFTTTYLNLLQRCYAPSTDPTTGQPTTWYANVRYTYTGNCSQFGNSDCGEQLQWNDYTP